MCIIHFFSFQVTSQELNAQVIVNSDLVNQTNQQIFKTLERTLKEFINTQVWTDEVFLNQEKSPALLFLIFLLIVTINLKLHFKFNLKDQFIKQIMIVLF